MRDEDTLNGTVLTPEQKTKLELIQCSLSLAVPLYIEQWRFRDAEERLARAEECAQVVAEHGDVILYRSRKDGETARAFNAFAEGVALCSFAPGGVTIFGLHFEA